MTYTLFQGVSDASGQKEIIENRGLVHGAFLHRHGQDLVDPKAGVLRIMAMRRFPQVGRASRKDSYSAWVRTKITNGGSHGTDCDGLP